MNYMKDIPKSVRNPREYQNEALRNVHIWCQATDGQPVGEETLTLLDSLALVGGLHVDEDTEITYDILKAWIRILMSGESRTITSRRFSLFEVEDPRMIGERSELLESEWTQALKQWQPNTITEESESKGANKVKPGHYFLFKKAKGSGSNFEALDMSWDSPVAMLSDTYETGGPSKSDSKESKKVDSAKPVRKAGEPGKSDSKESKKVDSAKPVRKAGEPGKSDSKESKKVDSAKPVRKAGEPGKSDSKESKKVDSAKPVRKAGEPGKSDSKESKKVDSAKPVRKAGEPGKSDSKESKKVDSAKPVRKAGEPGKSDSKESKKVDSAKPVRKAGEPGKSDSKESKKVDSAKPVGKAGEPGKPDSEESKKVNSAKPVRKARIGLHKKYSQPESGTTEANTEGKSTAGSATLGVNEGRNTSRSDKVKAMARVRDLGCCATGFRMRWRERGIDMSGFEGAHVMGLWTANIPFYTNGIDKDLLDAYIERDKNIVLDWVENMFMLRADIHRQYDACDWAVWPTAINTKTKKAKKLLIIRFESSSAPLLKGKAFLDELPRPKCAPTDANKMKRICGKVNPVDPAFFKAHFRLCLFNKVFGGGSVSSKDLSMPKYWFEEEERKNNRLRDVNSEVQEVTSSFKGLQISEAK
ncbi:hypothetical protein H0H92_000209 [Tricholoma furcatifolium]|nr:hypothetical protein H0H92_000209 [Tricholoma furcatifolium]